MSPQWEDIYRQFAPLVLMRARRIMGPLAESEAEDVLHDTFVKVMQKLPEDGESQPSLRLVHHELLHVCLNRLEQKRTHARLLVQVPRGGVALAEPMVAARNFLDRLDPKLDDLDRGIVLLHLGLEATGEETAEVLGCDRRTLTRRLKRIRELARAMRLDFPDEQSNTSGGSTLSGTESKREVARG